MSKEKNKDSIKIEWGVDDVFNLDDTLSIEEAREVLRLAEKEHDANVGINWDVLDSWILHVKESKLENI